MSSTIHITRKELYYGGQFWQKLMHTPSQNQKHTYWLHKLHQKVKQKQRDMVPEFQKLRDELNEKYAQRDEKGELPAIPKDMLPRPAMEHEEEFAKTVEAFMEKKVDLDLNHLSLDNFSHLQIAPLDWEILEELCQVTPEDFDSEKKLAKALASIQHAG